MRIQQSQATLAVLDMMKALEAIQDDPCVGLFWYDPDEDELFGVSSSISTGLLFRPSVQLRANVRTGGMSHKRVWEKQARKMHDHRFGKSHDSFPRGRVVEIEDVGYKVYTGGWIDEHPSAERLIREEFQLPEDHTEFVKDTSLVDRIE